MYDSLGSGTRVRLDVHAPDLGVKVKSLQSTLPGKVLNNIDVLQKVKERDQISFDPSLWENGRTSLPP